MHIWVEDEHRYGLISTLRRCWILQGQRVTVPCISSMNGAMCMVVPIWSVVRQFLYLPTVSLAMSEVFIEQLLATVPDVIHVFYCSALIFLPLIIAMMLS